MAAGKVDARIKKSDMGFQPMFGSLGLGARFCAAKSRSPLACSTAFPKIRFDTGLFGHLNDARRVLDAIGTDQDDVVFISADTRTQIMREMSTPYEEFNPTRDYLQNRGRKEDKHGGFHRVYEVNHSAWIAQVSGL